MKLEDISSIFNNEGPFWKGGSGVCSRWKFYPPKPAVYLLIMNETLKWGNKETNIIYIGSTKHFGGIESNCRLWDYHTKATQQEKRIVDHVVSLDAKKENPVKIHWTYEFPNNYTHKIYEKQLLKRFSQEHGKLPTLNRSL